MNGASVLPVDAQGVHIFYQIKLTYSQLPKITIAPCMAVTCSKFDIFKMCKLGFLTLNTPFQTTYRSI
jgi:hypothetical protein